VKIRFLTIDFDKLTLFARQAQFVYLMNDNEANKVGEKGTLATVEYMETKGINVKLIELPRPVNVGKVDLADYLKVPLLIAPC